MIKIIQLQPTQVDGVRFSIPLLNNIAVCNDCNSLLHFEDKDIINNRTLPTIKCECGADVQLHSKYYFKRFNPLKIFLITSKKCYDRIGPIADKLIALGHEVSYPNCFNNPCEEDAHRQSLEIHKRWKNEMIKSSITHIENCDAVLVVNLDVPNRQPHYIGGATLLEMYEAHRNKKKVYVYNELPDCVYYDELNGLTTAVINQDLTRIV